MSCEELHLDDASVSEIIGELERAHREINDDHITVLKEIIEEHEK